MIIEPVYLKNVEDAVWAVNTQISQNFFSFTPVNRFFKWGIAAKHGNAAPLQHCLRFRLTTAVHSSAPSGLPYLSYLHDIISLSKFNNTRVQMHDNLTLFTHRRMCLFTTQAE